MNARPSLAKVRTYFERAYGADIGYFTTPKGGASLLAFEGLIVQDPLLSKSFKLENTNGQSVVITNKRVQAYIQESWNYRIREELVVILVR